ncbi:MAG TPA: MlaD family protein [Steroidobacteraceae bacterium]|jgi:phospholipid/cholesterol/gamma-HCH transport system substrate-binding protein|nr:MlaD family protein [Steroidobacteraceae bacterium]
MEREANYLAVGSFVLLVLGMTVLFVYWYSAANGHRAFRRYEIYFDGSVSGLSVGSPVRFLGVDVGRVESIDIDPRTSDRVQVIAQIDPTTPIDVRTVAQLSLQGVTGVMFIDLRHLPAGSGRSRLANVPSEKYPVIASVHSNLDVLLDSLPDLAAQLDELLDRASHLLSERNLAAVDSIAQNVQQATTDMPRTMRDAAQLVAQLRTAVQQANAILDTARADAGPAGENLVATTNQLRTASTNLARASGRLDTFMAQNGEQISGLVRDGVPQLEGLLRDTRAAAQQIDGLARSLRDDPSKLLYQPSRHGVTIPP